MNTTNAKDAAREFVTYWTGKGYEKGQTQPFWLWLLRLLGVETAETFIEFEDKAHIDHAHGFIDGYIPATHVLVEQKSLGKSLTAGILQSDGTLLTPFQQAKRYAIELPYSRRPRWVVTCNFGEFLIYDMEKPNAEPESLLLEELPKQLYRLRFLVDTGAEAIRREEEISKKAGDVIGVIYDALLKQYHDPTNPQSLKSLNELCVRLVFLLYAEDADLFTHLQFHDYLKQFPPAKVRGALIELFKVLDTPIDKRDPYLEPDLAAFPYVNGGLFANEELEIPLFTEEILDLILRKGSEEFDWKEISPTIFGALFESTLNPETRRSGGMHYTSLANIHKVIDQLFLDELKGELSAIKGELNAKTRKTLLNSFIDKLASLTFLDPACGSGNFLTETYICLRRLENDALSLLLGNQGVLDLEGDMVRVSLSQFHGIEINDFACRVAQTALWIAENQMLRETESIAHRNFEFLPLNSYHGIVEGNALTVDWGSLVASDKCLVVSGQRGEESGTNHSSLATNHYSYIMGNPPFIGARFMSPEQKKEMLDVFGASWQNVGNLDYVCCWYKKACDYMRGTDTRAAFVSTNSITQGGQVADLWSGLDVEIDFAHRTFKWQSESKGCAAVHCVIVGFHAVGCTNDGGLTPPEPPATAHTPPYVGGGGGGQRPPSLVATSKIIFDGTVAIPAHHINGYLMDAPDIFIVSRPKPLCDVPEIGIGNKPIDDGNYLFLPEEKEEFVKKEPASAKYFRLWYGSQEFINNKPRWCLWLGDCTPAELRSMPKCLERVANVRAFRLASKSEGTRKLADKPTRFHVENMPKGNYIVIPEVSSEKRFYIPMGFMSPDVFCSNLVRLIPNATLYHFGVLTSIVHNAWMRVVCGRLKSDYRYSKDIVYNNFPWPEATETQKARIEATAQAILDARAKYPNDTLADLYDERTMPFDLRHAHQENDRAVMAAYGFKPDMTESECVAELFNRYQMLTQGR